MEFQKIVSFIDTSFTAVKGDITVTRKTFTADDIEAPDNTAANATATNNAMIMLLVKRNWFLKIMPHLSTVFHKLMV